MRRNPFPATDRLSVYMSIRSPVTLSGTWKSTCCNKDNGEALLSLTKTSDGQDERACAWLRSTSVTHSPDPRQSHQPANRRVTVLEEREHGWHRHGEERDYATI